MLPGGSYNVIAHYAGNGTFGGSDSNAVPVTVSTESSLTNLGLVTFNPSSGVLTYGATSATYGSPYLLRVDVTNSGATLCAPSQYPATGVPSYPCPTGSVTVTPPPTDQGAPLTPTPGVYALNSQGYAEDQYVQLPGGPYSFVASYAGDSSYNPSTSNNTIIITPAPTTITLSAPSSVVGTNISTITATINTQSYGAGPTGTVQFFNNGAAISNPRFVTGYPYPTSAAGGYAEALVTLYWTLPVGTASITAQYSGDTNYTTSTTLAPTTINVTDFSLSADPSSFNLSAGQSGTSTLTLTPLAGFTGTVSLTCSTSNVSVPCAVSPSSVNLAGSSAAQATVTITTTAASRLVQPAPQSRTPSSFRLHVGWSWLFAGLLALATLLSLAAARRRTVGWLVASTLLVVSLWVACGGAGGGGPAPVPRVSVSTTSLTFDKQTLGEQSNPQTVTFTNTGTSPLIISSITISGAAGQDFLESVGCGLGFYSALGPGMSCPVSVTFQPQAAGSRSATLTSVDNAPDSPQTVTLTGTGVRPPTQAGSYFVYVEATSGGATHTQMITVNVQ